MAEFHSFLWPGNVVFYARARARTHTHTHTHQVVFIHSSADGLLHCFHALAIVKNTAVKIGIHVSFQVSSFVSNQYMPGSGFPAHTIALFLVFEDSPFHFPW